MNVVKYIFIAPKRGAFVTPLMQVEAVEKCGLVGDRWFRPRNTYYLRVFNAWRKFKRFGSTNVSLITLRNIEEGNAKLAALNPAAPTTFSPVELRRNLVIDGDIDLNALLGRVFYVGTVKMRGDNPCTPCTLPPGRARKLRGQEDLFKQAFEIPYNIGGLRAKILETGIIKVGDALTGGKRWL